MVLMEEVVLRVTAGKVLAAEEKVEILVFLVQLVCIFPQLLEIHCCLLAKRITL